VSRQLPVLSRRDVLARLPAEHGGAITITDLIAGLLDHIDTDTLLLIACGPRQIGKSQAGYALAVTELFRPGSFTQIVSASGQQVESVFQRKLRRPLERLIRTLELPSGTVRFTARTVEIPAMGSAIEIAAPNEATVPGRSPTLLVFDEGRDLSDELFATLAPAVIGAAGKIVLLGTPGRPKGFFYELVEHPPAAAWLYRTAENQNPHASHRLVTFLRDTVGALFPAAMQRELLAQFTESGDELIPWALVEAAVDDTLVEAPSHAGTAFAFLDLGRKRDLSSLVVVARESAQRPETPDHLVTVSIQTWNPRSSPTGEVDFADVRAALDGLPDRFPNLAKVLVDEGAEAGSVLPFLRSHPRLSMRVQGFTGSVASNMDIWSALLGRLHAQTISIPRHERLLSELRGLRREEFAFGSKWRVVDSSRKFHRDVSLALAGATWAAGQRSSMPLRVWGGGAPVSNEHVEAAAKEQHDMAKQVVLDAIHDCGAYFPSDFH